MKAPRIQPATRRSASLATTASALMALVAIAAMTTAAPTMRGNPIEVRAMTSEAQTVRSVAAAVAAAARELMASERITPDPALPVQPFANRLAGSSEANFIALHRETEQKLGPQIISERALIDLPPPQC